MSREGRLKLRCGAAALALISVAAPAEARTAAELAGQFREIELDPQASYRVRDLQLRKDDLSIYLHDGFLAFAKPVGGRRIFVVYHATETGDHAEVLVRPPDQGERASLARYTKSPILNERVKEAVFISTDGSAEEMLAAVLESPASKPYPDMGLLLGSRMNSVMRNIGSSFQVRMVQDLLADNPATGFLYAALSGTALGNFDLLFDPANKEQIVVGQVTSSPQGAGFNVWASFETRASRRRQSAPGAVGSLSNYRIDSVIDPDFSMTCTTAADFRPEQAVKGALTFEIAPAMEILSVSVDGAPVEVFRRDAMRSRLMGHRSNEQFLIVLKDPMEAGRTYKMEFRHRGKVILPAGNNVFFVASRVNWYPAREAGHSVYDLTFRLPKHLTAVAAGDQVEDKEEGETRTVRWRTPAPIRMAGFNIGDYEKITVKRAGMTVTVYSNRSAESALVQRVPQVIMLPPAWAVRGGTRRPVELITITPPPPPNPQARSEALASEISAALEWYAMHFGPPPLNTLTVSPIPGNFGQGFPGLLYLSTLAFLDEKDRPEAVRSSTLRLFYSEILSAHEASHQWWGNLVGAATYHDEWISEALANYSAIMVLERRKGAKAADQVLDEGLRALRAQHEGKTVEEAGPITWGVRLRSETGIDPYRVITYDKGSWIVHMLRRRMGDQAFLAMLGELRKRYASRVVSTDQFRELAAEFSPKDLPDAKLEGFFDTWVYSTGIPTLELKTAVSGKAPKVQLTVTVNQTGVGEDFSIDVPVEIWPAGAKTPVVRWIRTSGDGASVKVTLPRHPQRVELGPGNGVLAVRK
ncbi:MAG: hypothetical protein C0504_07920 [Candidatus Solibacter sp.]|nr:hypothetical protein [Candidatus Solibacter sp.]